MPADEFDIIAQYFAPLATSAGARGLTDDAAVLETTGRLVITTDAIVEGVHFLPDDPIDTVAKKALRVNLSDLAAKGAKPIGIVLTLIWPQNRPAAQIADFARGLAEDLQHYGVALLGGDTTSTSGPLAIGITAFGEPFAARTPSRADAKAGEQIWVTGEIGDGLLGLLSLTTAPSVFGAAPSDQIDAFAAHVRARYRTPEPPIAFAETIARFASGSTDVSDGLIADADKIAKASSVALRLDAEAIPLSAPGHAFVAENADGLARLVTGGDDYQILFTAAPEHRREILEAGKRLGVAVALIGDVASGQGVRLIGSGGVDVPLPQAGHRHRLGQ